MITSTSANGLRPFAVFLSLTGILATGCGAQHSAPAAEASVATDSLAEAAGFGQGDVWRVGPERDYKTPSAVAGRVGDGDVVLIDAATYACDTGVIWRADRLTLKGVGGRPHLAALGCDVPGGKGIWVPAGDGLLIDNIAFSGAAVADENGAGIRFEGDGQVIIRNSYFHDNQNGILFTPSFGDSTDLLIEHSEFAYNGTSDGQAHNLYINAARSLTFRYNYSHDSHVGHILKSRARSNHILYNRLMTMDGEGSYEIDLPNGGDAWIIGNIIQQGPVSENRGLISYGAEAEWVGDNLNPDGHLYLVNNTLVNEHPDGADLLVFGDYQFAEVRVVNNLLVDIPESERDHLLERGVVFDHNLFADTSGLGLFADEPGFHDREHHNYAPTPASPAIGAGADPGSDHLGAPLLPDRRYRHPMSGEARESQRAGIDLGALDYRDDVPGAPRVTFAPLSTTIDYGADAILRWSAKDASRCFASGDWSGEMAVDGEAGIGPLNQDAAFELTCDGEGGTVRLSSAVRVADHPLAASFPSYRFTALTDTKIKPLCQDDYPYLGVGDCASRELSAAYVPEQNSFYLFGGADRSYFGNEVFRLDLNRRDLSIVYGPDDPRRITSFNAGHEGAWDMIEPCSGVWDLEGGGAVPAPSRVFSAWTYAPAVRKILKSSGRIACGSSGFDTDGWWFDPFSHQWQLIERRGWIPSDGSHAVYDPDNQQILAIGEEAIYRLDAAKEELIELGPFNDIPWSTTPALDPVNDVILIIGNGEYQRSKFTVIDLQGVDDEATSLPEQETWTAKGDLSLLDKASPGLAYDPDRKVLVGWGGGEKLYFISIDRDAREIEFIPKRLDAAPSFDWPKGHMFVYAEKEKAFLVYTGADDDFHLLKADD